MCRYHCNKQPLQPCSPCHCNCMVQCRELAWSLILGPVTTNLTSWQQQLLQQQYGWQWPPNLTPPWPALWNPSTECTTSLRGKAKHPSCGWQQAWHRQDGRWAPPISKTKCHTKHCQCSLSYKPQEQQHRQHQQSAPQPPTRVQQQNFQVQSPPAPQNPPVPLQQSAGVANQTTQHQPTNKTGIQQNIPLVMPGMIQQLQLINMPGKLINIISAHIPLSVKNKVWAYTYMDLGTLLESTNNPDEEEFNFFPDHSCNKISFRPMTNHQSINT